MGAGSRRGSVWSVARGDGSLRVDDVGGEGGGGGGWGVGLVSLDVADGGDDVPCKKRTSLTNKNSNTNITLNSTIDRWNNSCT